MKRTCLRVQFWLLIASVSAFAGCGPRVSVVRVGTESSIKFRDVTEKAGIRFNRVNGAFGKFWMPETMGGGGAFIDYDNDGYPDILLINGDWWPGHNLGGQRPTLALYHNKRDGTFEDVTRESGLNVSMPGMGVAVGDYDNDGYDDIYVTGVGGNRLFHNEAGKLAASRHTGQTTPRLFRDVTMEAGVRDSGWSTSAAWLDYDNDGRLDLFVCHYVKWSPAIDRYCGTLEQTYCRPDVYAGESCRLFKNEGRGKFTDVSRRAGIWNDRSKALGVCVVDLSDDRYPDLVIANDMTPNFLFKNNRNGSFSEVGMRSGIALGENAQARSGMGIDACDYRNSGHDGVAIGNFFAEGLAFYDLAGELPYAETSRRNGTYDPSFPHVTFGLLFADFDLDGFADLFFTNGYLWDPSRTNPGQQYKQPSVLLRNDRAGRFVDASKDSGEAVTQPLVGRGFCRGDFDNDGKPDLLLVPNFGPAKLLHNESAAANHWLAIQLIGKRSNRDGYGARVFVKAGGLQQSAYARSGSSYLSASDRRLFFGLGGAAKVESVRVRWPSGQEDLFRDVPVDRVIQLTEGTAKEK